MKNVYKELCRPASSYAATYIICIAQNALNSGPVNYQDCPKTATVVVYENTA